MAEGDAGSLRPDPPPAGGLTFTGPAAATPNTGFQGAYQNFQLPPGARWVTAPTMGTLLSDATPSIESIDPSLYSGEGQGGNSLLNSYTSGGASAQIVPWNIDPNYAGNPLLMGPAIPGGGTENLKAGTYTDPNPSSGLGTYYDYNLATGNATPTPQSLDLSRETIIKNSGGLINLLPMLGMGIPLAVMGSVVAPALLGSVAGLGAAGGGGAASLLSGTDLTTAALSGQLGVGATEGLGSISSAAPSLLGSISGAYQAAAPYVTGVQDAMKVANIVQQATAQPPQRQSASLLR